MHVKVAQLPCWVTKNFSRCHTSRQIWRFHLHVWQWRIQLRRSAVAFEHQGRNHQKSEAGVPAAEQNASCLPKKMFKNKFGSTWICITLWTPTISNSFYINWKSSWALTKKKFDWFKKTKWNNIVLHLHHFQQKQHQKWTLKRIVLHWQASRTMLKT